MAGIDDVSFRHLPDETGDTATFLTFFLPDEKRAREIAGKLTDAGVTGCPYWYDNNWHYVRKWEHLKEVKTLYPLSQEVKVVLKYLQTKFPEFAF